jgi:hypothetical protein
MEWIKQHIAVAPTYPHSAYYGMQKSLHADWTFFQRVVQGIGDIFVGIRDALQTTFLPSLLQYKLADDKPVWWLVFFPWRQLVSSTTGLCGECASEVTNSHLIQVMRGATVFNMADHQSNTQHAKTKLKEQTDKVNKEYLATIKASMAPDPRWKVQQGWNTGAWLSVLHSSISVTELSVD